MISLFEAMTNEERYNFEKWRIKMRCSKTILGILYCEWRATNIAKRSRQRILLAQLQKKYNK
jgi:hypothetical protein